MRTIPTTFLVSLLSASPLAAQALPLDVRTRDHRLDSGYLDWSGASPRVVFDSVVHVEDAAWLRLHFGDTNLPAGSQLRLVSLLDGAVQRFDMGSLRDYGFSSAYFNGNRVRVRLRAGPHTRGNRVELVRVELQPAGPEPDSICGNTDDRALSNDPRIGRGVSGTSACTWWLANEFTLLTAGHCTSTPSGTPWIIGFDIPLSTTNGTLVHPPPDDQYAVDLSSVRRLNAGIGADWAVMASMRNSNHGLYPGQKQGSWFRIGVVPGAVTGVDIRITGNGRVSPPVSPTWNAVTKTHVGPRVSTSITDSIAYRTDTTGGNSGSPVIHDQTGDAVGVHTHGGCRSTGGRNHGTRIDRTDLAQALAGVMSSRVAGSFRRFGQGCGGASVPQLDFSGVPDIGGQVSVDLSNLPVNRFGILAIGFSSANTALGPVGLQNCTLLTTIDLQQFLASGMGSASWSFGLPATPSLVSMRAYFQYFVEDPSAPTTVRAALSNGGEVFVGG